MRRGGKRDKWRGGKRDMRREGKRDMRREGKRDKWREGKRDKWIEGKREGCGIGYDDSEHLGTESVYSHRMTPVIVSAKYRTP